MSMARGRMRVCWDREDSAKAEVPLLYKQAGRPLSFPRMVRASPGRGPALTILGTKTSRPSYVNKSCHPNPVVRQDLFAICFVDSTTVGLFHVWVAAPFRFLLVYFLPASASSP